MIDVTALRDDYRQLRIRAEIFDDAQRFRIQTSNRLTQMSDDMVKSLLTGALDAEKIYKHDMVMMYRHVVPQSIQAFQKAVHGLGDHSLAMLLGRTGDPVVAMPCHWEGEGEKRVLVEDTPFYRTVWQLRAYCGHGAPLRRTKGMTAAEAFKLGDPVAKRNVFVIAAQFVKMGKSKYRDLYDAQRLHYAEKVHDADCPPCHAKAGQPWKLGHQHAASLRFIGQAFLDDLWMARMADFR